MKHKITKLSIFAAILIAVTSFPLYAKAKESPQVMRTVYGVVSSPFASKVFIALEEKKLPYTLVETLPLSALKAKNMAPQEGFLKASPLGKIPAYQEGDWAIADSTIITAYLDRANPKHPLYPKNAKEYAKTLWYEKYGDEVVAGVTHHKILFEKIVKPMLFKQPTDNTILEKAINEELPVIFDYLEKELEGKQWIIGDKFTAADIAIGTHFVSLKKCGVTVSKEKWPKLAQYIDKLFARESFKKFMS